MKKLIASLFFIALLAAMGLTIFPGIIFVFWVTDQPTSDTWFQQLIHFLIWSIVLAIEVYFIKRTFKELKGESPDSFDVKKLFTFILKATLILFLVLVSLLFLFYISALIFDPLSPLRNL